MVVMVNRQTAASLHHRAPPWMGGMILALADCVNAPKTGRMGEDPSAFLTTQLCDDWRLYHLYARKISLLKMH